MSSRALRYHFKYLLFGLAAVLFTPSEIRANFILVNPLLVESATNTVTDASILVPILFDSEPDLQPDPGFYHQSILLQKSTENYFKNQESKSFERDDADVYSFEESKFD